MSGPLSHLRVLDLSRVLAGPWAGQIFGDLGAEVIKIERPVTGDDTRSWGPPYLQGDDVQAELSAYFLTANRNKLSLAVDMAHPEGQELVRKLVAESDVVLENFKVGGLKRVNPKLIYCSITGFGQDGPYANRPGYDFLIQAMGGLMSITGRPDGESGGGPMKVEVALTDIMTGLYATVGVLAALNHRDRTGEGQHVDTALLDVQVA
jgi:glutaryl-CoA transferase